MIMRHYLWIGKRRLLHLAVAALMIGVLAIKVQRASAVVTLVYFHANWQADAETVVFMWETAFRDRHGRVPDRPQNVAEQVIWCRSTAVRFFRRTTTN